MLVKDPAIDCVVAGRDAARGTAFAGSIGAGFQRLDSQQPDALPAALRGAFALVDASGPFQGRSYAVPEACIELGIHYVDVADGRQYVAGFSLLDAAARAKGSLLVTGAGAIPAAAAALIDSMAGRFGRSSGFLGVLLTMVDNRTKSARTQATLLREKLGDKVFDCEIPVNVRLAEAPESGQTIFHWFPQAAGAHAYRLAAVELLHRTGQEPLEPSAQEATGEAAARPAAAPAAAPAADKVAQAVDAPESAAEPPPALGSEAEIAATLELDDSSPSHVN